MDYFGDAVWGGRARALLAAQHARDELLRRIDPDQRVRCRTPRGSRSRTGAVGVSLEVHVVDGRIYHRYVAHWQDPEKGSQRRRFLVERHGEEQALALAIGAREAGGARPRLPPGPSARGGRRAAPEAWAEASSGEGSPQSPGHQHGAPAAAAFEVG
jgi:hypothetical protein